MNKISVSIPGCNGRMGKTLLSLILENPKYEIASATCLPNEEEVGIDIGLFAGKRKLIKKLNAEPLSLFQNSKVLSILLLQMQQCFMLNNVMNNNMSIVIGTTGLSENKKKNYYLYQKKYPLFILQIFQ